MTGTVGKHFLKAGSARRLAISRIVFYGWYLVQLPFYDLAGFAALPAEIWRPPVVLALFPPPGPLFGSVMVYALALALLLACLGFVTRVSAAAVAVLSTYVLGVMNGYSAADFHFIPLVLISWILVMAPIGDEVSVDALMRRLPLQRDSVDYYWPVRLAQFTLIALMFTAGINKVLGTWLHDPAGSMRSFLLYKYYAQASEKALTLPSFTLTIADTPWLLTVMAFVMVACEFGCPLALPERWPRVRFGIIGGMFAMQVVLALWLKTLPTFPWLAAYAFWIPWEAVSGKVRRWITWMP